MKKEKYTDLIFNLGHYYNSDISLEVTKSGQSVIKILKNSIYGSFGLPNNDIRSRKIEKIINKI